MQTQIGQVNLGGIRYRIDVHEGMATFVELDRMSCARITVQKCEPQGLLYVQATSHTGFVPFTHIKRAVSAAESLFGPNHYLSFAHQHRWERNNCLSNIWKRPFFRPNQRLFWTHDIPFRFTSVWRAINHQYRLFVPERTPHIEWQEV